MELLHSYNNGNMMVSIYSDGTKIREYEGSMHPVHPESMDVKITNYCDGNCAWCHEMSDMNGKHADIGKLLEVIDGLPAGVEIAIGGGNPLTHPGLILFLRELKNRGLIANMTINQRHFRKYADKIKQIMDEELIYGMGVSYNDSRYLEDIGSFVNSNMVFHVIMGINKVGVIDELREFIKGCGIEVCKVLVLGYKEYGNGNRHYGINAGMIENCKREWYWSIGGYFRSKGLVLSFDNLAISQLNLRRFFLDGAWEKFYMGKEGSCSMYIDAVEGEFAICSVDPNRRGFGEIGLFEFFQGIEI